MNYSGRFACRMTLAAPVAATLPSVADLSRAKAMSIRKWVSGLLVYAEDVKEISE